MSLRQELLDAYNAVAQNEVKTFSAYELAGFYLNNNTAATDINGQSDRICEARRLVELSELEAYPLLHEVQGFEPDSYIVINAINRLHEIEKIKSFVQEYRQYIELFGPKRSRNRAGSRQRVIEYILDRLPLNHSNRKAWMKVLNGEF